MCNLEIYALSLPHFHSEFLLTHKHEKLSALEAPLRQKMMINVAKSKQKKNVLSSEHFSTTTHSSHTIPSLSLENSHLKFGNNASSLLS